MNTCFTGFRLGIFLDLEIVMSLNLFLNQLGRMYSSVDRSHARYSLESFAAARESLHGLFLKLFLNGRGGGTIASDLPSPGSLF
ncbi:MAG: hypothetical protein [Circoviridae sp.]|nr:MAG: hypothetical protein [Circoviridae sp.]